MNKQKKRQGDNIIEAVELQKSIFEVVVNTGTELKLTGKVILDPRHLAEQLVDT